MPNFSWLTWLQARQALAARLADASNVFWTDSENGLYLAEALRTWSALTEQWNADFAFTANLAGQWYDLSQIANSPRIRTLNDTYLFTVMEYQLLEPPSGSVWTGTSQFNIADFAGALQRRRDEMIQASGCNLHQLPFQRATVNVRRTIFNDSTLEPRRARFLPDSGNGSPVTLTREDTLAFDRFEPDHLQTSALPQAWSVITGPPLAMDVDLGPSVTGGYDVISLQSGVPFAPPATTALAVPDDWSWLAKWGAMADLLGAESERTDRQRAAYCLERYVTGLEIMKQSNWLVSGLINGLPVDTVSVREMDGISPEWQNDANAWATLVQAGMDLLAVAPTPTTTAGVSLILVGNAPIPAADGDFVQVSRDVFDVILDYAQVLAAFKMGGEDFMQTKSLEQNFYRLAMEQNKRLSKMGLFADTVHMEGKRQNITQPR
jgi:hypothetical protein